MFNPIGRLFSYLNRPPGTTTSHLDLLPPGMITDYSNAVGRYGPDSPQAKAVREKYGDDPDFVRFADGLDGLKRGLGGSGIDWEPREIDRP